MIRMLANALAQAIEWLAGLCVILGGLAGFAYIRQQHPDITLFDKNALPYDGLGALGGFCVALIVFGPLALIVQIEKHLSAMQPDADKSERHLSEIKADIRKLADAKCDTPSDH